MLRIATVVWALMLVHTARGATLPEKQAAAPAYINVAVASLWKAPFNGRSLDEPALATRVDLRAWTTSMSYDEKLWLVGKLETQALFGDAVVVLARRGAWTQIALPQQPTPRHVAGYPGWIPTSQLVTNAAYTAPMAGRSFARVQRATSWLYKDRQLRQAFMELSFNTSLPVEALEGSLVKVLTPAAGSKWLRRADVLLTPAIAARNGTLQGASIVATALEFKGLPYLWAGTSGFGFDCSGLTHAVHKFHGLTIPRDASAQAQGGTPIARPALRPGDLLFFAGAAGKGRVHHVAMYIGHGQMLHSPNTRGRVEVIPLDTPAYAVQYAGARRYTSDLAARSAAPQAAPRR